MEENGLSAISLLAFTPPELNQQLKAGRAKRDAALAEKITIASLTEGTPNA